MNIIEAIKSGKPLRRKTKHTWIGDDEAETAYNTICGWVCPEFFLETFKLTKEDILADDWEVEEKKMEINGEGERA